MLEMAWHGMDVRIGMVWQQALTMENANVEVLDGLP